MRAAGRAITPLADLSRGVVGVLGGASIVNLPGSPKGAIESFEAIAPRAGSRPRDPRRTVRSRDHARRPSEAGRLAADVRARSRTSPRYPLVFPIFWGAAAFFVLAMARHLRVFAVARPSAPVRERPGCGSVGLVEYAFVQTKMFKDPGRGHARRDLLGVRAPDDRDGRTS